MKLSDMFPRRYASGADLNGKAVRLTISHVQIEKMRPRPGAPEQTKGVVYFQDAQKGVIMSQTLAYQIAAIIGSEDTDDWTDKQVTLYPQPMQVAGQARIAIRARQPNGDSAPPASFQDQDDNEEI